MWHINFLIMFTETSKSSLYKLKKTNNSCVCLFILIKNYKLRLNGKNNFPLSIDNENMSV